MYEDDTPLLARESALRPDLIKELLFSSHLRPKIPTELIRIHDGKLKRTAAGYAPVSAAELLDWIKERLLIPEPEWKELAAAIRRDHDADAGEWLSAQARKLIWVKWPGVKYPLLCSLETLPLFLAAYQGVILPGESLDDFQQRLEQVFGWPAPVKAWEEYLLIVLKDLLSREFDALKIITVERINGDTATRSPFAAALRQFGFKSARNTLELWREY